MYAPPKDRTQSMAHSSIRSIENVEKVYISNKESRMVVRYYCNQHAVHGELVNTNTTAYLSRIASVQPGVTMEMITIQGANNFTSLNT